MRPGPPEVIEEYSITGMGHGTPLSTAGADAHGAAGPFMLEASISSTYHICRFWGLTDAAPTREPAALKAAAKRAPVPASSLGDRPVHHSAANARRDRLEEQYGAAAGGVGKVTEDALRAAGLMH